MTDKVELPQLDDTQAKLLKELLVSLNNDQKLWLGGYLTGINENTKAVLGMLSQHTSTSIQSIESVKTPSLKIFYGTRSGNSLKVAKNAGSIAESRGISYILINLNDYNPKELKKETNALFIVSTDGEGEAPMSTEEFYNYIHSKKAPKLLALNYSVLALGDKSYQHFCKTGKDIDIRLSELGGKRVSARIDCDIDFEEDSTRWIEKSIDEFIKSNLLRIKNVQSASVAVTYKEFSKKNPFSAEILDKIKLNGRNSTKKTYHIELSLENSEIRYEPGDALGVVCKNDDNLINELIKTLKSKPQTPVFVNKIEKPFIEALKEDLEISTLIPQVVEEYAKLKNNKDLLALTINKEKLFKYTYGRDIIDLLIEFPSDISPNELVSILRRLQPRLYSISSSYNFVPDEVHLTVSKVSYSANKRQHFGVCSNFLANASDSDLVNIYIDENISFRLPEDDNTAIIMIGAGTGIAPYRAFLQERQLRKASGKNWLFFGDRNFETDFLYQIEWQRFIKDNTLSRMDVAFSRDQEDKIYVQHKLLENKKEFYHWIEGGAHIYVCGDKNTMANDVRNTILQIIEEEGSHNSEKASEYFKSLRKENRYHEDVY